jgi:hypothetical protein
LREWIQTYVRPDAQAITDQLLGVVHIVITHPALTGVPTAGRWRRPGIAEALVAVDCLVRDGVARTTACRRVADMMRR